MGLMGRFTQSSSHAIGVQATALPAQALPETSKSGSAAKGHAKRQLLVSWTIHCKHCCPHAVSYWHMPFMCKLIATQLGLSCKT